MAQSLARRPNFQTAPQAIPDQETHHAHVTTRRPEINMVRSWITLGASARSYCHWTSNHAVLSHLMHLSARNVQACLKSPPLRKISERSQATLENRRCQWKSRKAMTALRRVAALESLLMWLPKQVLRLCHQRTIFLTRRIVAVVTLPWSSPKQLAGPVLLRWTTAPKRAVAATRFRSLSPTSLLPRWRSAVVARRSKRSPFFHPNVLRRVVAKKRA